MEKKKTQKIITTIHGHKVLLIFADKANSCVSEQIKQYIKTNLSCLNSRVFGNSNSF